MENALIPIITALISTTSAFVSVVFSRRAARGERLAAAEQLATKFREPFLQAVFNLQTRIYNIVELGFFGRFLGERNSEQEREYAVLNTLYVFAQYFCWVEILRRDSQFIDPRDNERNRRLDCALEAVRETLSDSIVITDPTFRIFRGEQRALGEIMLVPVPNAPPGLPRWDCLGYAPFVQALDGSEIARWFRGLREDIEATKDDVSEHDIRLRLVQGQLIDIVDVIDPHARRVPSNLRQRVRAPSARAVVEGSPPHRPDGWPAPDQGPSTSAS